MLLNIAIILVIIWAIGFFARLAGHIIHAVLLIAFFFVLAHHFKWGGFDRFERTPDHEFIHKKHHTDGV